MRFAPLLATITTSSLLVFAACSSDDAIIDGDDAGSSSGRSSSSSGGPRRDAGSSGGSSGGGSSSGSSHDAGGKDASVPPEQACEGELALYEACGLDNEQCGPEGYVVNCHQNETAVDSTQRIAARARCLDAQYCEPDARATCIYRQYNDDTQSPAQATLLEHYCAACEPANEAACKARTLHFNGDSSTIDTIFLASWELSATLVQQIETNCIPGLASGDAGTCADRFDDCAGGYYIDALVDACPGD